MKAALGVAQEGGKEEGQGEVGLHVEQREG